MVGISKRIKVRKDKVYGWDLEKDKGSQGLVNYKHGEPRSQNNHGKGSQGQSLVNYKHGEPRSQDGTKIHRIREPITK